MRSKGDTEGNSRRRTLRYVVVLIWAVAAVLAALLLLRFVLQSRHVHAYRDALAVSDTRRTQGDLSGAVSALDRAASNAQSAQEWLSVLKRVRELAAQSGDTAKGYSLLDAFALRAADQFPGNQSIWAVSVWSELRGDKVEQAASHASRYLLSPRFEPLRLEALFRAGKAPSTGERSSSQMQVLAGTASSRNPDLFRQAGDLTGDKRFYVDMALLLAGKSVTGALQSFDRFGVGRMFPAPAALLAFDAGDFEAARSYIGLMPASEALGTEMVLLQADMYMAESNFAQAATMYQDILHRHPDVSPVAYRNLAYLSADSQPSASSNAAKGGSFTLPRHLAAPYFIEAEQYLAVGMKRFPDDPELVRSMAALQLMEGSRDQALSTVNGFVASHPGDRSLRLYRILHLEADAPVERTTAQLWNLVNSGSDSDPVGQVLAGRLLVLRDFNGLRALLSRYKTDPVPQWVGFFRAVVKAEFQDTATARAGFETIWEKSHLWQAAYDAALTYLADGSVQPAMQQLDAAEQAASSASHWGGFSKVSGLVPADSDLAWLEYRRAEVLAALAQPQQALEVARRASTLDPANSEVAVLVRKLDAAIQR